MTVFVEPPFWARPYTAWSTITPHVGVQWLDTDPIVEPITVDDAKLYLRVTVPDEDADISRFITAARVFCEARTGRPIAPHTCDVFYDGIAPYARIILPFAPVQSVTSISTTDVNGLQTPIDPSLYLVDLASVPPRIGLPMGQAWPMGLRPFQAVAVRLVVGYPVVPEDLVQAMRFLIGHFYEARLPVQQGVRMDATLPFGVDALLQPYVIEQVA